VIEINILVLCNVDLENKWGDYSRVFSLMNSLKKNGHNIFILIIRPEPKKPRISYLQENGFDIVEIHPFSIGISGKRGILRHLNYLISIPTIMKEASKIISKHGIDYVYSYMPGTGSSLPAMKIKSKFKIPLILDLADMYSFIRPKYILNKSFKEADKIIVITNYLKQDLISKNIPKEKIVHIPNGVDLELFHPNYDQHEIQMIKKKFNSKKIVLFAGSLQDLTMIIESAKYVVEKIPDVKYIIIGDHRDPNRRVSVWKNIVKEKGLENYFDFLGKLPKNEIPKYVAISDVCVDSFPDEPYFAAAHPLKILEYGACKKPILATNVSETSKLVKHNEFGLLAEPENFLQYGEFLVKILTNDKISEKLSNNFYKYVISNFNWDSLADIFEIHVMGINKK
jgi:glycosyltransferase involved in cell wall biosynthesis